MEEQYIVKKCFNGNGFYFYYKNGKLHREAGPAIVRNPETLHKLGDEHLYKEEIIPTFLPEGYTHAEAVEDPSGLCPEITVAVYYVEGNPCPKREFSNLKKIMLNKTLNDELPINATNTEVKKLKI